MWVRDVDLRIRSKAGSTVHKLSFAGRSNALLWLQMH